MVKNTTGGSGHKSQARKLVSGRSNNVVRVSQEEGEKYAIVTKIIGNGMCNVTTEDGATLLCHIRGKFKGRNKKNSIISSNSIILVGIREWESIIKNCDLIEVYSTEDVQQLRSRSGQKIEKLEKLTAVTFRTTVDDSFIFSNEQPLEPYFAEIPEQKSDHGDTDEDFIAFDDI